MTNDIVVNGLDAIDITTHIDDKKRRYMAITLESLELALKDDPETYKKARKAVLDGFNDYTRSLIRVFFGEIEDA